MYCLAGDLDTNVVEADSNKSSVCGGSDVLVGIGEGSRHMGEGQGSHNVGGGVEECRVSLSGPLAVRILVIGINSSTKECTNSCP